MPLRVVLFYYFYWALAWGSVQAEGEAVSSNHRARKEFLDRMVRRQIELEHNLMEKTATEDILGRILDSRADPIPPPILLPGYHFPSPLPKLADIGGGGGGIGVGVGVGNYAKRRTWKLRNRIGQQFLGIPLNQPLAKRNLDGDGTADSLEEGDDTDSGLTIIQKMTCSGEFFPESVKTAYGNYVTKERGNFLDNKGFYTPHQQEALGAGTGLDSCEEPAEKTEETVGKRALCPYQWRINMDPMRVPMVMFEAYCLCNKSQDANHHFECEPITLEFRVLKRASTSDKCTNFVESIAHIQVGCVAIRSARSPPEVNPTLHVHHHPDTET